MPWNGYNFEDSILISEKVVRRAFYNRSHQEFSVLLETQLVLKRSQRISRMLKKMPSPSLMGFSVHIGER